VWTPGSCCTAGTDFWATAFANAIASEDAKSYKGSLLHPAAAAPALSKDDLHLGLAGAPAPLVLDLPDIHKKTVTVDVPKVDVPKDVSLPAAAPHADIDPSVLFHGAAAPAHDLALPPSKDIVVDVPKVALPPSKDIAVDVPKVALPPSKDIAVDVPKVALPPSKDVVVDVPTIDVGTKPVAVDVPKVALPPLEHKTVEVDVPGIALAPVEYKHVEVPKVEVPAVDVKGELANTTEAVHAGAAEGAGVLHATAAKLVETLAQLKAARQNATHAALEAGKGLLPASKGEVYTLEKQVVYLETVIKNLTSATGATGAAVPSPAMPPCSLHRWALSSCCRVLHADVVHAPHMGLTEGVSVDM
jgi:hypothetical protein